MATYTPTVTPRLRMTRHSPVHYSRSSHLSSTSASEPSRFPDFSQLVDVNLAMSETSDQSTFSKASTPSTVTRSDNPAAVLRALLSRLPPTSPSTSHAPSQYASERESDYDISETPDAITSTAQDSLKDIFSKARREPGDTPLKSRLRRHSVDISVDANPLAEEERSDYSMGKRRSLSDEEMEQTELHDSSNRTSTGLRTRSRISQQPITMEFLRERFSDSTVSPAKPESHPVIRNSSNVNTTILGNLNSSQSTHPESTTMPQQSLRMSVNSQFHSNLLDQDMDMGSFESYGKSSRERSISPPPTIRQKPKSIAENFSAHAAHHSINESSGSHSESHSQSNMKLKAHEKPLAESNKREHDWNNLRLRPMVHPPNHLHSHSLKPGPESSNALISQDETQSSVLLEESNHHREHNWNKSRPHDGQHTPDRTHSHLHNSDLELSVGQISWDGGQFSGHHKFHKRLEPSHINDPNSRHSQHHSVALSRSNSPSGLISHDGPLDERERNWNSPHPTWHTPSQPQLQEISRNDSFPVHSSKQETPIPHKKPPESPTSDIKEKGGSPLTSGHSPTPSRSSSLQAIDNTYHNHDPSLRHTLGSPSQRYPLVQKQPASSSTLTTSRKARKSVMISPKQTNADTLSPSEDRTTSKHLSRTVRQPIIQDLSIKSSSGSHNEQVSGLSLLNETIGEVRRSDLPVDDHGDDTELEELKETDFSSQEESPIPVVRDISEDRHQSHPNPSSNQVPPSFSIPSSRSHILVKPHDSNLSPKQHSPSFSTPSTMSRIPNLDDIPPRDAFTDFPTPSTPPRRSTPKSSRKEYRTPSPPKGLPDLPSPSSSEKSEHNLTSFRDPHDDPPNPVFDSTNCDETEEDRPRTPTNYNDHPTANLTAIGQTPRPPGGWVSTPVPPSWRTADDQDSEQRAGLLTPVASLSKGTFDPKTPAVPGGWLRTPAPRKSILKVRFNADAPSEGDIQYAERSLHTSLETKTSSSDVRVLAHNTPSTSPRSLRRPKTPNVIRVLDAFGREQDVVEGQSDQHRKPMLRVVDAMGCEVPNTDPVPPPDTQAEMPVLGKSSRGEVLSFLRQGLDDLAEEIDDIEKDHGACFDKARIEELDRASNQARGARERLEAQYLQSQGTDLALEQKASFSNLVNHQSSRSNLRFYIVVTFIQIVLLLLLYRIAINRAKSFYLNSYYDPFNPEVHLYVFKVDASLDSTDSYLSRTLWYSLPERLLGRWDNDIIPSRAWLPT